MLNFLLKSSLIPPKQRNTDNTKLVCIW